MIFKTPKPRRPPERTKRKATPHHRRAKIHHQPGQTRGRPATVKGYQGTPCRRMYILSRCLLNLNRATWLQDHASALPLPRGIDPQHEPHALFEILPRHYRTINHRSAKSKALIAEYSHETGAALYIYPCRETPAQRGGSREKQPAPCRNFYGASALPNRQNGQIFTIFAKT